MTGLTVGAGREPDAYRRLTVGLGELTVAEGPGTVLTTFALGSCVAIALYDDRTMVGGLLHAFLPDGTQDRFRIRVRRQPSLFVNPGLDSLLDALVQRGAERRRLVARLAGGATLVGHAAGIADIGRHNLAMARGMLERLGIPVLGEDVGGHRVRTAHLHLDSGALVVHIHGYGEVTL
jgi:chemotaxis protein CheD